MARTAKAHAFMSREAVENLGIPVGMIPGDGDIALIPFVDQPTHEHRTLLGDGSWFRAWLACAAGWAQIVPTDLGSPYFPVEAPGWPEDWCDQLAAGTTTL